jgi:hypothetical protein
MDINSDRRSHPRAPLKVQVDLLHDEQTIPGRWTTDISQGGVRMQFLGVPIHSPVKLMIRLPQGPMREDHVCVLQGEIAWRTLRSTGISFVDPPEEELLKLRTYVHQQIMA